MKILIAGPVGSGQNELLSEITNEPHKHQSCEGLVLQHVFKNKYFSASCGIWIDEYTNVSEWCAEFRSDEAAEVREALLMFIFTFGPNDVDGEKLNTFVDKLRPDQPAYAVPLNGISSVTSEVMAKLETAGFDVVDRNDVKAHVDTALYDAINENGSDGHEELPNEQYDADDLDSIMEELRSARGSSTMTNEEKETLANKIAERLVI